MPLVALQPAAEGPNVGMGPGPLNVLFLSTWNSARTILAEALIAHWGADRFRAFSAGSHPRGMVHPNALNLLQQKRLPVAGLDADKWPAFRAAFTALEKRIKIFTGLPPAALESLRVNSHADAGLLPVISQRFGVRNAYYPSR